MSGATDHHLDGTSAVLPDGTPATGNADYDALPRCVKDQYSYLEWQWLSGAEKGGLLQTETEPEF